MLVEGLLAGGVAWFFLCKLSKNHEDTVNHGSGDRRHDMSVKEATKEFLDYREPHKPRTRLSFDPAQTYHESRLAKTFDSSSRDPPFNRKTFKNREGVGHRVTQGYRTDTFVPYSRGLNYRFMVPPISS